MPFAGMIFVRRRPGSPWIPTPISISPSPSSKSGLLLAGGVHAVRATPMLRVTELTFSPTRITSSRSVPRSAAAATALMTKKSASHAAAPDGVGGVLHGDVIVDEEGLDVNAFRGGHFPPSRRPFFAGVVVDEQKYALG